MINLLDELLELAGCNIQLNETVSDIKLHNAPSMSVSEFRKVISYDPFLYQYLDLSDAELGQKSNSYLQWLVRHWDNVKNNSAENVRNLLNDFTICKNRHKLENGDINSYNSISEILDAVNLAKEQEDSLSQQQRRARNASRSADSDILLLCSGDIYDMYYPKTYAASVKLGKNTHWCTATNSDDNYYNEYSKLGPLFVFINKKDNSIKYQLWYSESGKSVSTYDGTHTLHDQNNDREPNSLYDILRDKKIYDYLHNNPKITPYLKEYWPNVMKTSYDKVKIYDPKSFESIFNNLNVEYDIDGNGNYIIDGDLDLRGTEITSLPDNLKVCGYLDLSYTSITSLPDNLEVGSTLYLRGTKITSLPNNLKFGGNLYLSDTEITSLPDNLQVGGNLDLRETNITSLPNNLKIDGNLNLSNTNITSLPDNLQVGGYLDLWGTNITSLPDNLQVGSWLCLSDTNITSLPDNLKVSGEIFTNKDKLNMFKEKYPQFTFVDE